MTETRHNKPWNPAAEFVSQAIEAHTRWLESKGKEGSELNLEWADLRELDIDLRSRKLDKCHFKHSDLRGLDLTGASLVNADLTAANLEGTTLAGADLHNATLINVRVAGADFSGCTWDRADFTNASGEDAHFDGCRIDRKPAERNGPMFQSSELPAVTLRSADLSGARFQNAKMPGAVAEDAVFDHVQMEGIGLDSAILKRASFRGANLHGAKLERANCERATFANAILKQAHVSEADFTRATFQKANLKEAAVRNVVFGKAEGLFGKDRASLDQMKDTEWVVVGAERDITWEVIRSVGSLAIFSASGLSLAAILIYAGAARWFNAHLKAFWSELNERGPSNGWAGFVPGPLEMPTHLAVLLVAILVLAAASLMFRFCCPAPIKECTELQWVRALQAPRLEYLAAKYSRPGWRYLTAVLYVLGGGYIVGYAVWRIWITLNFAITAGLQ